MLELDKVKKQYGDFLLDCSLTLQEGCITGLIGRNGAGKSTTFKAVLDLITIDSGRIRIFGKEHNRLTPKERERIGVVLSDSGFSEYLTVEQVEGILKAAYEKFDSALFQRKCKELELPMKQKIKEFSTGMRAKLKLLAAISHQAELLLLDEPTAGLDVIARDQILDMLRDYMENTGKGILISSHISSDLEGLCDDLYMIQEGKMILHEDTDVLLSSYGLLKVDALQYEKLDKDYLLCRKRESFGYSCLTSQRQFYQENYPGIVIEKGTIDEVITMMIKGETL